MSVPKYSFTVEWTDADDSFIALCPEFPGLSAFGDTPDEAVREAMVALGLMIEVVEESGEPLPEPLKFVYGRAKAFRAALDALKEWWLVDVKLAEGGAQIYMDGAKLEDCTLLGVKIDALRAVAAKLFGSGS